MRHIITTVLIFLCVEIWGQQLSENYKKLVDESFPVETLPFWGCNIPGGRIIASYPENMISSYDFFTRYDLKKTVSAKSLPAIYARFLICTKATITTYAIQVCNDIYRLEYLINVNSEGNIIDSILVRICNDEYGVEPMQYKIEANKRIIVRQAEITSIVNAKLEDINYTPSLFNMRFIDKTYTIDSIGKFVLKDTIRYAIEKKQYSFINVRDLNIIKEKPLIDQSGSGLKKSEKKYMPIENNTLLL